MPNIEMHGFETHMVTDPEETTFFEETKIKINQAILHLGLEELTVITVHHTTVEKCDSSEELAPFLRICASDDVEVQDVVEALREQKVGVDCETLRLDDFFPDTYMNGEDAT
jgi:hypothetical protein